MDVQVFGTKQEMGMSAAEDGAKLIREAIAKQGSANIVVATGSSQLQMLSALAREPDIDWHRVTGFHLDEYVGLPATHPASFRRYLWERFVSQLPCPLTAFHYIDGEGDCQATCQYLGKIISQTSIDVAFVGIGENGHLAFNDPPADFDTRLPYFVATLDLGCRQQQCNEGWFPSIEAVPQQAITMSIHQIMQSESIICTVPDERKAVAVCDALEGEVSPIVPASILNLHRKVTVYLDVPAASRLTQLKFG